MVKEFSWVVDQRNGIYFVIKHQHRSNYLAICLGNEIVPEEAIRVLQLTDDEVRSWKPTAGWMHTAVETVFEDNYWPTLDVIV
jgi:hypothetical protein